MPAVSRPPQQGQAVPSCASRIKMGFAIGFTVGFVAGGIFGGFTALRAGFRNVDLLQSVAKTMIQGGFTFGTFMGIGTGIRC